MKLSSKTIQKLRSLGVGIAYLFGSRAQGTATHQSDYDIGIVFIDSKQISKGLSLFTEIYSLVSEDIPDLIQGARLDISFLQQANPALAISAITHGTVLFENDAVFRANFEEAAVVHYDDYLPIKKSFEEATLSAFRKS